MLNGTGRVELTFGLKEALDRGIRSLLTSLSCALISFPISLVRLLMMECGRLQSREKWPNCISFDVCG
jgi:hypothetical protein